MVPPITGVWVCYVAAWRIYKRDAQSFLVVLLNLLIALIADSPRDSGGN